MISPVSRPIKQIVGNTASEGLKVLGKNLKTLAGDYGHVVIQDHDMLKVNALIFSTLILSLSRIGISYGSAQKAKETPEEQYRRQEFIRTSIREIGGWTFSYVALRFFERQLRNYIRSEGFLGLGKKGKDILIQYFEKAGQQFKAWRNGTIRPLKAKRGPVEALEETFLQYDSQKYTGWKKALIELFSHNDTQAPTPQKIEKFHKWFPLIAGSIPSVILSGYYLERFTMDHSDRVVNAMNSWFNKGKPSASLSQSQSPFHMTQTGQEQDFNNFIGSLHQKHVQRVPQSS